MLNNRSLRGSETGGSCLTGFGASNISAVFNWVGKGTGGGGGTLEGIGGG